MAPLSLSSAAASGQKGPPTRKLQRQACRAPTTLHHGREKLCFLGGPPRPSCRPHKLDPPLLPSSYLQELSLRSSKSIST